MMNIFKVVDGDISKKDYRSKHNFFQKRAKNCFLQENFFTYASEKTNILISSQDQYKKETNLNLKNFENLESQLLN